MLDRASNSAFFAYPFATEETESVAWKYLELGLAFAVLLSLRNGPRAVFLVELVSRICQGVNIIINYGTEDHARAKGNVER